ncbi:MAG: hypothetical protein Q8R20_03105 [Nanoarchaeota archaeon]|nr:hypothetical protein [Nanoarchaeota archaeon]
MEALANILGFLITIVLMFGPIIWFFHATEVFAFITGCIGGIFEETTNKKGIF